MSLTVSRLKKVLRYEPETGKFFWLSTGRVAGCKDSYGYPIIKLHGKIHKAHRLAFLYMTGRFPPGDVDHINLDRGDNRWANLRAATRRQNNVNVKSAAGSASRFVGVYYMPKRVKWAARIRTLKGRKFLGYFDEETAAAQAYHNAAKKEHGEFARGNPEAFNLQET